MRKSIKIYYKTIGFIWKNEIFYTLFRINKGYSVKKLIPTPPSFK